MDEIKWVDKKKDDAPDSRAIRKKLSGLRKKCHIFCNIESQEYTDMEKAYAIREVLNMPTHNSITKDEILKVAKYLFDMAYEEVEGKQDEKKV